MPFFKEKYILKIEIFRVQILKIKDTHIYIYIFVLFIFDKPYIFVLDGKMECLEHVYQDKSLLQ